MSQEIKLLQVMVYNLVMNWLVASGLMFFSSVVMYLLVRYAARIHISGAMQNVAMFTVPFIVFAGLAIQGNVRLGLTPWEWGVMLVTAIGFSYFGGRFSIQSIQACPNPGYSLMISKSYVVMTSVLSIYLFHQSLTIKSIFAILCIVGFSSLIMISPQKNTESGAHHGAWLLYSLGAFFCWGMLSLASKYLLLIGVPVVSRLFWVIAIASSLFVWDAREELIKFYEYSWKQRTIFINIGLLSAAFNYFMQVGIQLAPNVGYVNAVNASSIAAVTIGASLLFGDEFSQRKLLGVIGVTVGLIILVL